ncbi:hypothetical protein MMC34_000701 [Xylographa carneopallida]|nr:hypothetical protein [Xylographa carneopallida]
MNEYIDEDIDEDMNEDIDEVTYEVIVTSIWFKSSPSRWPELSAEHNPPISSNAAGERERELRSPAPSVQVTLHTASQSGFAGGTDGPPRALPAPSFNDIDVIGDSSGRLAWAQPPAVVSDAGDTLVYFDLVMMSLLSMSNKPYWALTAASTCQVGLIMDYVPSTVRMYTVLRYLKSTSFESSSPDSR